MIRFLLLINKQGQTRLAKYYSSTTTEERISLEGELVRKCLSRTEKHCAILEQGEYKIVYRRYASLYVVIGLDNEESVNELSLLEFIHNIIETLDRYFEDVVLFLITV
eukprot:TRINITY_DN13211_c0_g1_i3.p1 TRINITY_DN13211_c0_g1~~TRINITY_DN13211_c0_g1_i3.p1  ORF type:complete len:108 (+),score=20.59 TRINITY_DN13211_c0_g1_i3:77-400(+)